MPTVTINTGAIDTMLQQASPAAAAGSSKQIGVDTGTNVDVISLLTFSNLFGNGAGQIPIGATITSATLTLQTTNGSNQGGSLHRMLVGWNAQSTWNSLANGVQFDNTDAVATADVVTGSVAVGSRGFDVTKSLQAWSAGATNYGWAIKAGGTDGWDFYSSEGTTKPFLTITYTTDNLPPPPPPPPPVVSVQSATQTEGLGARMSFTVTLDRAADAGGVVVNYATQSGTATSTNDFVGVSNGSITFAQGETSKTIEITLTDDNIQESTETFSLRLISATGATLSTSAATATGTIRDNDDPGPPPIQASVVKVTDITLGAFKSADQTGYGIGDPSGLAYVPGLQKLFIADSEHDESPYFSNTNLYSIGADGVIQGYNLGETFSIEPTGLAYNPKNGRLYITDDDARKVFWVDPSNPTVKLGEFSTVPYGSDSEDPKFDPVTGNMFMLDGESRKLYELTPTGGLVRSLNLPSVMSDAEALAYDPNHDVFFVGNGSTSKIWEMDRDGNILATLDIFANYRNPLSGYKPSIKGLELAPSSNPNDGNAVSLFVADYGVDQRNDGRLLEVSLGSGWLVA